MNRLDSAPARMHENPPQRAFFSAPQSVSSFVAAVLEPGITALLLVVVTLGLGQPLERPTMVLCLLVFALTLPGTNRFRDRPADAAVGIVASWIALLTILALCGYATRSFEFFDGQVLLSWALVTPAMQWLATAIGQSMLHWYAANVAPRRTAIIVGAGALAVKVAHVLQARQGVHVFGQFDDRAGDRVDAAAAPKLLGRLNEVADYVVRHGIREVYITLPLGMQPRIVALLEKLQETTASICFVPDVFGITVVQGRLQDMSGVPVVGICETPFTGTNQLVKRVSDIVLSSLILLLTFPVMLAIAIGVKLSSPGPIIFGQRRNGLDGREITVYKFRSMQVIEDGGVVRQATRDDPRVTRFGAFIRRRSLDELPQFFNVLQGSMSIVGPRPHAVQHNQEYLRIIKAYMVRHKVKPGITGWAQVNGQRGETDTIEKMRARVEYDLEYMRNWSLVLDLRIIVGTIRVVFFDRKAY